MTKTIIIIIVIIIIAVITMTAIKILITQCRVPTGGVPSAVRET